MKPIKITLEMYPVRINTRYIGMDCTDRDIEFHIAGDVHNQRVKISDFIQNMSPDFEEIWNDVVKMLSADKSEGK